MNNTFLSLVGQLRPALEANARSLSSENSLCALTVLRSVHQRLRAVYKGTKTIDDIPDDVLICIFKIYLVAIAECEPSFSITGRVAKKVDTSGVHLLTHVCQRWRRIMLGYSRFWSRIDGARREQLAVFIRRSRLVPLTLALSTDITGFDDLLSLTASRVQRLDLFVTRSFVHSIPTRWLNPNSLQCFTITYPDDIIHPDRPSPPIVLFGEKSVSLKALAIHNSPAWLPANHFPQLTHLHLEMLVHNAYPDICDISRLLTNTPKLKYLHIRGIPSFEHGPVTPLSVHLPNLRFAVLAFGALHTAMSFVSTWTIPANAFVCFDNMIPFDGRMAIPPRLSVVERVTTLQLATDGQLMHLIAEGSTSGLWLQGLTLLSGVSWTNWLDELHTSLPLPQITTLRIFVGKNTDVLRKILRRMPRLVELYVRLERKYEVRGADPSMSVAASLYRDLLDAAICPNLRTLGVDIQDDYHASAVCLWAADMAAMATERSAKGVALQRLVVQAFAGCGRNVDPSRRALQSDLAEDLAKVQHIEEVTLCCPGAPTATFERRACWDDEGTREYWLIPEYRAPYCRLPWKFEPQD
ncbi:hypothetical protein OH76DRAFT_1481334 [Lentinus brumalis]|uniref:F-box domain-containing protein n=1 Tax=Lentinus brumalis TaxID=2498619 RepID=A0A371DH26_9APHY|nr:hypothetical protein OH76DRAFT_1481334 [Polyporus brumalis]